MALLVALSAQGAFAPCRLVAYDKLKYFPTSNGERKIVMKLFLAKVAAMAGLMILTASPSMAGALALGCDAPVRSVEAKTPIELKFANFLGEPIVLRWLDYAGKPVQYATLLQAQSVLQPTYATHPWRIETASGRCVGIVIGSSSETVALTWNMAARPGARRPKSYCVENPGVCAIGLLLGAAALNALTQGGEDGSGRACQERYVGRDHMGSPIYRTECR